VSLQRFLPFLLSMGLILFNYVPSSLGISSIIRPDIGCICVFYWVLYRPDLFNMFWVFCLGLLSDMISSMPFGINIITYLTIYTVNSITAFLYNKPFIVVWYGFAFVFIITGLIKWLIVSVYYAQFLPISRLFFTILFTIACYPVISFINDLVRKLLMNDES